MKSVFRTSSAFTLIELMLVVTIIGILAAIAIPKYMNFQCRSKQVEARQSLGTIAKLEETYYSENDRFTTNFTSIGFGVKGKTRYDYVVKAAGILTFEAEAASKDPGIGGKGPKDDIWTINQSLYLTNTLNPCN